ncbi:MAG: hypothetical protein AB7J40_00570 [Candidatus Altimarinota bacterium]
MAFLISISGICAAGFFEHSSAFSSERENIVQDAFHSHAEDKSHPGDEHCTDENETNDTVVFQTINLLQNQISSTLGALFSVQVGVESSAYEPLYKTDRTLLTNNSLQRHIRSVVMRF